jgi:hypothetical protein
VNPHPMKGVERQQHLCASNVLSWHSSPPVSRVNERQLSGDYLKLASALGLPCQTFLAAVIAAIGRASFRPGTGNAKIRIRALQKRIRV